MPAFVNKNALPGESPVAHKSLIIIFSIYFLMVMSKRLWMPSLQGNLFWFADVVCWIVIPGFLIYSVRGYLGISKSLKLNEKSVDLRDYGTLIFETLLCLMLLYSFDAIGRILAYKFIALYPNLLPQKLNYSSHLPSVMLYKIFLVIYFSITAAVVEEFFFRRVIKEILVFYKLNSNLIFILGSSILFGLAHWAGGSNNVINSGLSGVALAIIYAWTKDLRPVMAAHFIFDFFHFI